MAISVKPVLISEKQMEAIKKIQEEQRKKSEVGVAPTIDHLIGDLSPICRCPAQESLLSVRLVFP